MQLKCTWSGVSPKLWLRYRRIVVLGLPASHMPCNTNTNGEYGGWRSSSKPAFWMTASASADVWSGALSWLQVTSMCFLNWKNSWKDTKVSEDEDVMCTTNGWLNDQVQQFLYNGIRALEKCWTKCSSVAGEYVEKWQNMMCVSRSQLC